MRFIVFVFFCLQAAVFSSAKSNGYAYEKPSVAFSIPAKIQPTNVRAGFATNVAEIILTENEAAEEYIEPSIPAVEIIRTEPAVQTEVQAATIAFTNRLADAVKVAESEEVEATETVAEEQEEYKDLKFAGQVAVASTFEAVAPKINDRSSAAIDTAVETAEELIEAPTPAKVNVRTEAQVEQHIEQNPRIPVGNRLAEALRVAESQKVEATPTVAKTADVAAATTVQSKGYSYEPPAIRFQPPLIEDSVVHQELGSVVKSHRQGSVKRLKLGGNIAVSSNQVEVPKAKAVVPVPIRQPAIYAPTPVAAKGYSYEPPKISFDAVEDNFVHQELGSQVKPHPRGSTKRLKPCRNRDINQVLAERSLKRPQDRRQAQYAETLTDEGYFQQEVSLDV